MNGKLVNYVINTLIEENLSITAAESLTGGLFQSEITTVPGSSAVLKVVVTYSDEVKTQLLNVPQELIQRYGVVSYEVAWPWPKERKNMQTDFAISFTGAAGPTGLEGEDAGTAWIGVTYHGQTEAYKLRKPELERNAFREACCQFAFQQISDLLD